jgi:hypothetical protein
MKGVNQLKIGIQGLTPVDQRKFFDKLVSLKNGESIILKDWNVLDGSGIWGSWRVYGDFQWYVDQRRKR